MNIQVESNQSVDRNAWERLSKSGSFFQTFAWVDICSAGLNGEAVFFCGYDQNKLIAGMAGIIVRRYGFKSFLSMPYDTYGGVVYDTAFDGDEQARVKIASELMAAVKAEKYSNVIITDRSGYLSQAQPDQNVRGAFTQVVDLGEEPGLDPPDKKIMGHVRAGEKLDSEIVDIRTDQQLDQFYALYCATSERHNDKELRHSKFFFKTICDKLSGSDKLIFIALMVGEKMAGAHLAFLDDNNLINWQTVSDYSMRHFKSNHLLMRESIVRAIKQGVRYVNLGASPESADRLVDFKARWGGQREPYDIITIKSRLRGVIDRWRG